jgi:hypothetical protein
MTDVLKTITDLVGIDAPDAKTDAKEGVKAESKGILNKFRIAFDKATDSKDAGMLAKVKIFFTSLWDELTGVDEEKKGVTAKTQTEVEKAVAEAMGGAKSKVKMAEGAPAEEVAIFDETLAMGVASKASLDAEHTALADSALAKVETRFEGKNSEKLTFDETTTMAALGLMTLKQLRNKYPDKFNFIKAVEKLSTASEKSNYPVAKLFSGNVLDLFRIDLDDNTLAAGSLLGKFGMGALGIGALGKFGKEDAIAAFNSLKTNPIPDESKAVAFFHDNIFVNTSVENVTGALRIISTSLAGGVDKLNPLALTDLVFLIDDKDYQRLVTALVGKSNYLALEAGKPGNS